MTARIGFVMLWLASLVAVSVWAQSPGSERKVISGSNLGFRIERVDRTGAPIGRFVVRSNGRWVEVGFATGVSPLEAK